MEKKPIYKTIITLVVLSEDEIPEDMSLGDIMYECDEGAFIGGGIDKTHTVLKGEAAVAEIKKAGSTPDFFQMDDEGNEIEE